MSTPDSTSQLFNWEADSGNQWTVPFGGGFGKIFRISKQPLDGQIQAFYHVEKPEFGPEWQLRVQLQFFSRNVPCFPPTYRYCFTLVERKSRVPQIQGVQGRSCSKLLRAFGNTEDGVSLAFP